MLFFVYLNEKITKQADINGTGKITVIYDREGFKLTSIDNKLIELFKNMIEIF